eukprot:Nitzschia sp. Nitz4//scaffold28_size193895//146424//146975//NITZ4_001678-RA/size193895-processed-gene-0.235-mRNA-1//1//CDS//3329546021//1835//frame0
MCTKLLQREGMKGSADANPDALWEIKRLRTRQGEVINPERFEGSITVISLLPLLPGMAAYYEEMMEYLHSVYSPLVEFVIIPIDVGAKIHLKERSDQKVVVLEEETAIDTHPWVKHLSSIKPRSGAAMTDHNGEVSQVELETDRLNVYIVSADGYFVERFTVPTLETLKQSIAVYLKTIDYEL